MLALFMFAMTFVLWFILLGWVIHLWSIIDAALFEPPGRKRFREDRYHYRDRYYA